MGTKVLVGRKEGLGWLLEGDKACALSAAGAGRSALGVDLTQTGWHFMPTGRRGMEDPVECLAAALRRGSHTRTDLPACAVWACLVLAFACASNIHWALSGSPSRAQGHVLRPHGHRTHSEGPFWVTHRAKGFVCVLCLNSPLRLPTSELWPGPITVVNCPFHLYSWGNLVQ